MMDLQSVGELHFDGFGNCDVGVGIGWRFDVGGRQDVVEEKEKLTWMERPGSWISRVREKTCCVLCGCEGARWVRCDVRKKRLGWLCLTPEAGKPGSKIQRVVWWISDRPVPVPAGVWLYAHSRGKRFHRAKYRVLPPAT